jgi:lipopolysaccharide/colanic/teichoic acid biosynthesis glycosyltransferase
MWPSVSLLTSPEPHRFYNTSKRALDICAGLLLLLLVAPVILIAAAAVAVAYRTNPFYVSSRVGHLGREFPMIKLKSMSDGLEASVPEHLNETGGPTFKCADDPRVTRLGRILRLTSIDELPQLLNVVMGRMTLVGPRPPLPREVILYTQPQLERLRVKPGITCIWQVSGRSDVQFRTWMAMDRAYVRRRSVLLDLWLLLRTPWAVLVMRGAR